MLNTITKKLSCLLVAALVACSQAEAANTGINTNQTVTAAPGSVNLSGVAASQGTSLAHARADHVHSVSGILPAANGGTGAGALTCSALQSLTSNGTLYSCHDNGVNTNSSLTGSGTSGSVLGINLANTNTWTVIQNFTPSGSGTAVSATGGSSNGVAGVFVGGAPNGQALTATGTGVGNGGTITGGSPAAGSNGGIGLVVSAGTTNSSSNGLAGGFGAQVSGTNGTNSTTAAGTGGSGGYAVRGTSGAGGVGNTSGPGGSGGDVYITGVIGTGGQGGSTGNGGVGGRVLVSAGGDGGSSGATSGTGGAGSGGVTSAAIDITAGVGGGTGSGVGAAGAGGNAGKFQGGTGGTTSGAGTGGAGGIGSISIGGNGGGTSGGTFGSGGIGTSATGGNAGGSGANGGIGEVLTGGNGSGAGINGTGLSVGSGTGGSGTGGGGLAIAMTQNNTVRAHTNKNPLAGIPSTLVNGDEWISGATTAMTSYARLGSATQPYLTGGANGARAVQAFRAGSVCTTSASAGASCNTTVTLPVAYPDANYTVVCVGLTGVNVPVPSGASSLTASTFAFSIVAITAAAATFGSLECITIHD